MLIFIKLLNEDFEKGKFYFKIQSEYFYNQEAYVGFKCQRLLCVEIYQTKQAFDCLFVCK